MVDTKKVSWNSSEGLIMEISNRRSLANSYFIQRDIRKAFSTLVSIKHATIQSFTKEERNELLELEEKFSKVSSGLSYSIGHSFDKKTRNIYSLAFSIASKIYSQYNDKLMDLLEDRGYLISEMSDSSKMKF